MTVRDTLQCQPWLWPIRPSAVYLFLVLLTLTPFNLTHVETPMALTLWESMSVVRFTRMFSVWGDGLSLMLVFRVMYFSSCCSRWIFVLSAREGMRRPYSGLLGSWTLQLLLTKTADFVPILNAIWGWAPGHVNRQFFATKGSIALCHSLLSCVYREYSIHWFCQYNILVFTHSLIVIWSYCNSIHTTVC